MADTTEHVSAYTIRRAVESDAAAVAAIDDESSSEVGSLLAPAAPGELDRSIADGSLYIAVRSSTVVGYLCADRHHPGRLFIAGIAIVHSARGHGIGASLLTAALDGVDLNRIIVTGVASPLNLASLNLLFTHGFVGRWALLDHFGPGQHRIGLQMVKTGHGNSAPISVWLPAGDIHGCADALAADLVIHAATLIDDEPVLGLTNIDRTNLIPCAGPEP